MDEAWYLPSVPPAIFMLVHGRMHCSPIILTIFGWMLVIQKLFPI